MSVRLHHVVTGPAEAPVLVLSGSLGTTLAMWERQVAPLSASRRVVAVDLRGQGASPGPSGPYAIGDLGGDVLALMDELGIARFSFCGLSIGGMVGQWLGAHAPERVERLVLLCTSAQLAPPAPWRERAATVRAAGGTAPVADAVVDKWLTPDWAQAHPADRAALRAMLVASPPEGYASCCEAIAAMDLREELGRITAPTLVVAGAQDAAIPPEHGERLAAGIAGARFVLLDPAAHVPTTERADAVTELITTHLETP